MINQAYIQIKLDALPAQQKPYIAGQEGIALVFWGLLVLCGIIAVALIIGSTVRNSSRKPTKEQQEKRARIVAARHKHLTEHE